MTTFFTEADVTGTGETTEAEVWLATEFTVPDGIFVPRWRFPAGIISVTPQMRVFNAAGTLVAGPTAFDSITAGQFNSAGTSSPVSVSAGTYRVVVNTTRYVFRTLFWSGGPIVRGDITGVQSRFGAPGSAPTSTSTATYFVDIDFTPTSTVSPSGLAVPVSLGAPTAASTGSISPSGLAVPVSLGEPAAMFTEALAPSGLAVPVSLGEPVVAVSQVEPSGLIVDVSLGVPSVDTPAQEVGGSWMGYLAVIESAKQDAKLNAERRQHPVECPYDGWPLDHVRGVYHCAFGGHIITPSR